MRRLILIAFVLTSFAACGSPIVNGDLVYLSLREDKHLSLRDDSYFKCSTEEKLPLIYVDNRDSTFAFKTQDGLNVYFKYYFLRIEKEEPAIFTKKEIDGKIFPLSPASRYIGCNGKEVFQADNPFVTINKY